MSRDSAFDVLIDAGRDLLGHLSATDSADARRLIEEWSGSRPTILKRMAIWGVAQADWMTPDEKLEWVLRRGLLYAPGLKAEVFEVVALSLHAASKDVRREVLAATLSGSGRERKKQRTADYEIYNLLAWLTEHAPADEDLARVLADFQEAHPDFQPRPYPDLDMWTGPEWGGFLSPANADELLMLDPTASSTVDWLTSYEGTADFDEEGRTGLLEKIGSAAARSPGWATSLLRTMSDGQRWTPDVWSAVVSGVTGVNLGRQAVSILRSLETYPDKRDLAGPVARFLAKLGEGSPSHRALAIALNVSDNTWKSIEALTADESLSGPDWLTDAINQTGGHLTQFWLQALSIRLRDAVDRRMFRPWTVRFQDLLVGRGSDAEAGRIVLASQSHFLLAIDRQWWSRHVLPRFAWDDPLRSEQMWEGYLMWTRLNEALIDAMLPSYVEAFEHVDAMPERWRERFTEHLASIALLTARDPLEEGWLIRFAASVSAQTNASWARHVGYLLRNAEPEVRRRAWEKWMRNYWTERNSGLPRPLAPEEHSEMAAWVVSLPDAFDDAVELYSQGPRSSPRGFVWSLIDESPRFAAGSSAAGAFLLALLEGQTEPFYSCPQALSAFAKVDAASLPEELKRGIQDRLLGLGCMS